MSTNVVIDTSVFISALISNSGMSRAILRQCFEGIYQPLMGNALFYEYTGVMHRPEILSQSPLSLDECQIFLNSFISICKWTQIYYLWRPNLRDEGDNHLIELALAGGAKIIITYNLRDFANADLHFPGLRICRPGELLQRKT